MYDLIIIGGGPAGISVALEAEIKGLNYLILEKGYLVNSIYNFPTNMTFFSTSLKLEIGETPFISHLEKPTRKEALEYYRRVVDGYNLNIKYRTNVESIQKEKKEFVLIDSNNNTYKTKNTVIATGYYDNPRKLNIEGEELPKVKHYYDDAHPYIGMNVLVIGAANSACDVALETWQKGANVTMVVRKEELYPKVKYWIRPNIENRIKEGSIKCYFNSQVSKIDAEEVTLNTPNGEVSLPNDYVLAMTGYLPDFDFIRKAGININGEDQKPQFNTDTLESNISNLYIAGVIAAGNKTSALFIENTRHHGKMIVDDIISKIEK